MDHSDVSPELLARVAAGDSEAFRGVVERYEDLLFDLAFRLTGSRQDSEDLVQEAFVRIFQALPRYDPRRRFVPWIYTITLNLVRNHLRRRALLRFLSFDFSPAGGEGDALREEPADQREGPAGLLEQKEFHADLERAVAGLPPSLKEVFVLHYFHELDLRTIAGMLGASENAVKLRLMRARNLLQALLAARHPERFSAARAPRGS